MSDNASYREACAKAQIAKERLSKSAQEAKIRIAPARLKQDAVAKVKGAASRTVAGTKMKVREKPFAFAAAGGALVILLARRPALALLRRSYVRFKRERSRKMEVNHG